ncbi:hypothetical protein [Streptomyces corynorhini]|uniref:hypothetical protein n=1 Tax=Streptomyces corynorhini TaxID=2282652 RepID=UPI001F1A1169|nr:hypothetical protein [Streptomyces corynorhini]
MVRNVIGSLLALAGAAAAVLSPFRGWYDGRLGRDYRITDLFHGVSDTGSGVLLSLLLPFAFAALLTLIGLAARSRALVALAGLVVLGFTVLWMVRQGQSTGSLTLAGDGSGLGVGVAYALGGGLVLLLAALTMSGRRRRVPPSAAYPDGRDGDPGHGDQPYGYAPAREPYGYGYGDDPRSEGQLGPDAYGGPDPYGQNPHGQSQYGQSQYGQNPYGQEPYPPEPHAPHAPPRDEWSHDGDTQSLPVVQRPPRGRDG